MEKHFGADQDPQFLFNQVITEVPDPVSCVTDEVQHQLVASEIMLKDTRNFKLEDQFPSSNEIVKYASMGNSRPNETASDMLPPMILSKPMLPDLPNDSKRLSEIDISSIHHSGAMQFDTIKTQSMVSSCGVSNQVNNRYNVKKYKKNDKVKLLAAKQDQAQFSDSEASGNPVQQLRIADFFTEPNNQLKVIAMSEHKTPDEIIRKWTGYQPYQDAD